MTVQSIRSTFHGEYAFTMFVLIFAFAVERRVGDAFVLVQHSSIASKFDNVKVRCSFANERFATFRARSSKALPKMHANSLNGDNIVDICSDLNKSVEECADVFKDRKVMVGKSEVSRLGLIATQKVRKGDSVLSIPFKSDYILEPQQAFKAFDLPKDYNGWTGDAGLLALLLLNQMVMANEGSSNDAKSRLMRSWLASLPSYETMKELRIHPLLWDKELQEILQYSSTRKIHKTLDDIKDDFVWLNDNILSKASNLYPERLVDGTPCFNIEGFTWAIAIVQSRSFFLDGSLQLVPIVDMANHCDLGSEEVQSGFFGPFRTTAGVQIKAAKDYKEGEEIFVSYGPKSAAEYVLEHGFIPPQCYKTTSVAELTFQIDDDDRFLDDKLDILEFETYQETGPMQPIQSFDVVASPGTEVAPDPAMLQFLRLAKIGFTDAFLLESIFRKEVWGFMSEPVSEMNELAVVEEVITSCKSGLQEMTRVTRSSKEDEEQSLLNRSGKEDQSVTPEVLCATVRAVERKALEQMIDYMEADKDALDLKEYYQERRLKGLGLDSEWDPENSDVGWSTARVPGGGELDW